MGMLLHHTWLEQQKAQKPKKTAPVEAEEAAEEKPEEEPQVAPVKRTGGRRTTKK